MTDKESSIATAAKKFNLPPLTQQAIQHVDGTPDREYPLRILKVYRQNCDSRWMVGTWDEKKQEYIEDGVSIHSLMNQTQRERTKLLDEAIKVLEEYYKYAKKT